MMEPWRENWREFAPDLPVEGLQALADALKSNDSRLQPGNYFVAPDGSCVVAACAIGYVLWRTHQQDNVLDLMHRLKLQRLRGMKAHRFTEWFDSNSPGCHAELLPEVNRELARRHGGCKDEAVDRDGAGGAAVAPRRVPERCV